jgi:hypothetical protein
MLLQMFDDVVEVAKVMPRSGAISGPPIVFKNNGTHFPLVVALESTRRYRDRVTLRTLSRVFVHLKDSKRIAFEVQEIAVPAGTRNGKLLECDLAAVFRN